jgi:HSP20 family protein
MSLTAYDPFAIGGGFGMDPWKEMRRMTKRMNRMLGDLGMEKEPLLSTAIGPVERQWIPTCDIRDTDKHLIVHAELPGVKPEDVKLEVRDGRLHICGERKLDQKEEGERYLRSERFYGKFARTIPLPRDVDMNNIQANYDHGVLEVCIPKPKSETKPLTINIGRRGELPAGGVSGREQEGVSGKEQGTTGTKGVGKGK